MIKRLSIIFICIITAFFYTSCKKCVTCTSKKGNKVVGTQDYCGKKKFNDVWSAAYINNANAHGYSAECVPQ